MSIFARSSRRIAHRTPFSTIKHFLNRSVSIRSFSTKKHVEICETSYPTDDHFNIPASILERTKTPLTTDTSSPLNHLKLKIERHLSSLSPALAPMIAAEAPPPTVSVYQNFTSLLIPSTHQSRAKTDSYYINSDMLLRTHSSAHQEDLLKQFDAFNVTGDVYRRDQIDCSHFPVFHQMEGVRLFDQTSAGSQRSTEKKSDDAMFGIDSLNAIQHCHSEEDMMRVSRELRQTLESLFSHLFKNEKQLEYRWVPGSFPFTSPSWELEVLFNGAWLELCGCGIIRQEILDSAGKPGKIGWAFGLGLERIAMTMHRIPDIRLFWSKDPRFLKQFAESGNNKDTENDVVIFKPFSKHPACYKDISFYFSGTFEDNDLNDIVRDVAGDLVESVELIDTFVNVKKGMTSKCYRVQYRAMDRNCTNEEIDLIQEKVRDAVVKLYAVEMR